MILASRLIALVEDALDKVDRVPVRNTVQTGTASILPGGVRRSWSAKVVATQDGELCLVSFRFAHPFSETFPIRETEAAGILRLGGIPVDERREGFVQRCAGDMLPHVLREVREAAALMRGCGLSEQEMTDILLETSAHDVHEG